MQILKRIKVNGSPYFLAAVVGEFHLSIPPPVREIVKLANIQNLTDLGYSVLVVTDAARWLHSKLKIVHGHIRGGNVMSPTATLLRLETAPRKSHRFR